MRRDVREPTFSLAAGEPASAGARRPSYLSTKSARRRAAQTDQIGRVHAAAHATALTSMRARSPFIMSRLDRALRFERGLVTRPRCHTMNHKEWT